MTTYIDYADNLNDSATEYDYYDIVYEGSEVLVDPVKQIKVRMVLIVCVALMISTALALLALPAGIQARSESSFAGETEIAAAQLEISGAVAQEPLEASALKGTNSIAPFFTPEVLYWEPQIVAWANQYGLDPNAIATIMQIESCGNPQAVSVAGARGLFQVMPFHFTSGENMLDPDTNAMRGMNFFNEQLRYTGGDVFLSFAGYNGGYAASGGEYANWANETQRYFGWAKGIYEDAQEGSTSSETLNAWLAAGGGAGCDLAASQLGLN